MIIAFMGIDGSGKTTLARRFRERLRVLGLDVQYKAEFDYFLLGRFFQLFGKERVSKARMLFLTKKGENQKPSYFKVWPYLVWLDLFLEWLWNKLFKRNSVVIMDRYAYDFLMSWEWLGYANDYIRWLYYHFPRPDVAFILDVSPTTAYLRKKESHIYPLHFYEVQKKRYLNLAKALGIRIINTEKAVDECLSEVFAEFRIYFINKLPDEDKVLLFYSYPKFKPSMLKELNLCFDWSNLNWEYIVDMAVKCNTENLLCKNLLRYENGLPSEVVKLLKFVLEKSNKRRELLVRTLKAISRKLGEKNIPFVIIKTIAPFDYGPTDIDIVVRKEDFERTKETLSLIFKVSKSSRKHKAITYQQARQVNMLPIDVHYEISWLGVKFMDGEEILNRKRNLILDGLIIPVPSVVDEILILTLHSVFQHHYTTLGEFFFIYSLLRQIDYRDFAKTSKTGTQYIMFVIAYSALKGHLLYGEESLQVPCNVKLKPSDISSVIFFHPFSCIPKRSFMQLVDVLLTFYRRLRFKVCGELPYNKNWIKVEK
ncbi:MAG: nucleotidyltransferase family protein [Candidatus Aenigmatarchaeota archaeon]